jgi:hypothetical protein
VEDEIATISSKDYGHYFKYRQHACIRRCIECGTLIVFNINYKSIKAAVYRASYCLETCQRAATIQMGDKEEMDRFMNEEAVKLRFNMESNGVCTDSALMALCEKQGKCITATTKEEWQTYWVNTS